MRLRAPAMRDRQAAPAAPLPHRGEMPPPWRRFPAASSRARAPCPPPSAPRTLRSEEHTSELQSLMRISYAVFCLKKKITTPNKNINYISTHRPYTFTHDTQYTSQRIT